MTTVALVGHSFHKVSRSEDFFVSLLERHGVKVHRFWCDGWQGGNAVSFKDVSDFPAVIMWQVACPTMRPYAQRHPNVTFVPMLDNYVLNMPGALSAFMHQLQHWRVWGGAKILCFSSVLHAIVEQVGIYSKYFQCYPRPSLAPVSQAGMHGFFWLRREDMVNISVVERLLSSTNLDSMHVHVATDPNSKLVDYHPLLVNKRVTVSTWFDKKEDYKNLLFQKNIYFAPRSVEGIGFSFLEAFCMGQCVVAPDFPTMNEYIVHNNTGLLYDIHNVEPLDFSAVHTLGGRAWETAQVGYEHWKQSEADIVEYILTPNARCYASWHGVPLAADVTWKQQVLAIGYLRPLVRCYRQIQKVLRCWCRKEKQ